MTVIEALARHIAARLNLPFEGRTAGSVFFGYMPERPVRAICVYASGLCPDGDARGTSAQICVRSDLNGAWPLEMCRKLIAVLEDMRDRALVPGGEAPIRALITSGASFSGLYRDNTQIYTLQVTLYTCAEEEDDVRNPRL